MESRGRNWQTFSEVFAENDLLLSPTSQLLAPTIEDWAEWWSGIGPVPFPHGTFAPHYTSHTHMFNWLGFPAAEPSVWIPRRPSDRVAGRGVARIRGQDPALRAGFVPFATPVRSIRASRSVAAPQRRGRRPFPGDHEHASGYGAAPLETAATSCLATWCSLASPRQLGHDHTVRISATGVTVVRRAASDLVGTSYRCVHRGH